MLTLQKFFAVSPLGLWKKSMVLPTFTKSNITLITDAYIEDIIWLRRDTLTHENP